MACDFYDLCISRYFKNEQKADIQRHDNPRMKTGPRGSEIIGDS